MIIRIHSQQNVIRFRIYISQDSLAKYIVKVNKNNQWNITRQKNWCDSSRKIFQVVTKFDQQNLFLVWLKSLLCFCRFDHMCLKAICEPNQFSQLNNCLLGFKSHHELMSMEENSSNYEGNTTILQKFSNVH